MRVPLRAKQGQSAEPRETRGLAAGPVPSVTGSYAWVRTARGARARPDQAVEVGLLDQVDVIDRMAKGLQTSGRSKRQETIGRAARERALGGRGRVDRVAHGGCGTETVGGASNGTAYAGDSTAAAGREGAAAATSIIDDLWRPPGNAEPPSA